MHAAHAGCFLPTSKFLLASVINNFKNPSRVYFTPSDIYQDSHFLIQSALLLITEYSIIVWTTNVSSLVKVVFC
jgi:hypothetical protein